MEENDRRMEVEERKLEIMEMKATGVVEVAEPDGTEDMEGKREEEDETIYE
jgi:hypothetical protein